MAKHLSILKKFSNSILFVLIFFIFFLLASIYDVSEKIAIFLLGFEFLQLDELFLRFSILFFIPPKLVSKLCTYNFLLIFSFYFVFFVFVIIPISCYAITFYFVFIRHTLWRLFKTYIKYTTR